MAISVEELTRSIDVVKESSSQSNRMASGLGEAVSRFKVDAA